MALRLVYGPRSWNFGLEAVADAQKVEKEKEKMEKFLLCESIGH